MDEAALGLALGVVTVRLSYHCDGGEHISLAEPPFSHLYNRGNSESLKVYFESYNEMLAPSTLLDI